MYHEENAFYDKYQDFMSDENYLLLNLFIGLDNILLLLL